MLIDRGSGISVFDDQGREYIEAMSGLWSVAVGFGEERLVEAAARQMRRLSFYPTFAHSSNEPSIQLATKLVQMTPAGLDRVFFANSGSEANDTVVKLVWYYNNAIGRPNKKKFIARYGGYHGATVAAGSLTGMQINQSGFDLPLPFVHYVSCPHQYRFGVPGESEADFTDRLAADLEATILEADPDTVAAFIGEPLMGAGGVLVPPEGYWERVQEICRRYDVLVVADEVITGFGRLGVPFACDLYGIKPDMLVLSKQLTSSYVPLAAVVMSDAIYQALADLSDYLGAFGHGFTTSGHPVAAAVALENLAVIEERGLVANAAAVGVQLQTALRGFAHHPLVGEVRGVGLIAGVELVADKETRDPFHPPGQVGSYLSERAAAHGLIVRNIDDTIAFCPPMIITAAQCVDLVARFARALEDTHAWVLAGRPAS
jgi:4-aminobutyrate--pyruvate transaminase